MNLNILQHNELLQALGWAVLHSLWQCLVLYLLYKCIITLFRKTGSNERYLLALITFFASGAWFIFTFIDILNTGDTPSAHVYSYIISPTYLEYAQQLIGITYVGLLAIHLTRSVIIHSNQLSTLRKLPVEKAPVELRIFLNVMAERFSIGRKIVFTVTDSISVPMVKGFFKPTILLPISAITGLDKIQLESIIIHELAHIKRHDYIINLFQIAFNKILFFNPFLKLIEKEVSLYRENSCDDIVMLHGYDKTLYSKALLQLELNRKNKEEAQYNLCLNATNGNKPLLHRIKRLFDENTPITNRVNQWRLICTLTIILLGMATISPVNSFDTPELRRLYNATLINTTLKGKLLPENNTTPNQGKSKISAKNRLNNNKPITIAKKIDITNPATPNVFVNSEWRNTTPTIIGASYPEEPKKTSLIQITEEGSDMNDNKVYYFEVDKSNGAMTIQPIMVIQNPVPDSLKCHVDSVNISHSITL